MSSFFLIAITLILSTLLGLLINIIANYFQIILQARIRLVVSVTIAVLVFLIISTYLQTNSGVTRIPPENQPATPSSVAALSSTGVIPPMTSLPRPTNAPA